ncbi:uncharacterized protein BX664DRAFT_332380 [Halteromyces radiatus]|uniref:uncharacterized protein n=1 Tax=Halteromyces radiatus TaxID=101107 RepID=UPI00221E99AD|nr:uncharacterized protein BX664DRAFT_332380 [Halteromyces radiatus]KAI8089186.1 hypothetical protein BX664DRAFT_332380 [Halteromyces radiatus]
MLILKRMFSITSRKTASKKPQLDQVSDIMIPGQYLRYFKPKKTKSLQQQQQQQLNQSRHLDLYTETARPLHGHEWDATPTITQERMAQRIQRALSTVYSMEVLPTPLITQEHLTLRGIKVSRNLKKCFIFYEPTSTIKKQRGQVHRALINYSPILNTLIKNHAQLRKPLSIKFVSDTQSKELEAIYDKLEQETGQQ